jgi:hypothetical protein
MKRVGVTVYRESCHARFVPPIDAKVLKRKLFAPHRPARPFSYRHFFHTSQTQDVTVLWLATDRPLRTMDASTLNRHSLARDEVRHLDDVVTFATYRGINSS